MKKIYFILIFLFIVIVSNSKIIEPKHEIEASLGVNLLTINGAISYKPSWNKKFNNNMSVDFGPKVTLQQSVTAIPIFATKYDFSVAGLTSLNFGINSEFNFLENQSKKIYIGLEAGIGVEVAYFNDGKEINYLSNISGIGKFSLGLKAKQHKIGGYLSYGKGILGLEYGYTLDD